MRKLVVLLALALVATVGALPVTDGAQALESSTVVANAYFNGTVDEAAVYTTALTAGQVSDHFTHNHG